MPFHQKHNSQGNYSYNIAAYTDEIWNFHFHKNLELIYIMDGAVNCTVNQRQFRLERGSWGLCLPYDIHRYEPETNAKYWVLVFSGDYVRFFLQKLAGMTGDGFGFVPEDAVAQYVQARLVQEAAPSDLTLKSCLYALCEVYLNQIPLLEKGSGTDTAYIRICQYIQENHTKQVTLSQLADMLGYDYHYVSRYFRNVFSMTFSDFLNSYRVETALRLLQESSKPITEIAYESGFQSVRNFNSLFRKSIGTTPSLYRKNSRQNTPWDAGVSRPPATK